MLRIDILGFADCPNLEPTVRRVRQAIEHLNRQAEVSVRMLSEADDPAILQFLGSPTVQVNGLDIEPEARRRSDYAFGCRIYSGAGMPPTSMIEAAILEATAA